MMRAKYWGFLRVFAPLKRQTPDHRIVAEAGAHAVDGVFGLRRAAIDEVSWIGLIQCSERA